MNAGRIKAAFASMVSASPEGVAVFPSSPGDGFSAEVRPRLNLLASLVTADGSLVVTAPVVTKASNDATLTGKAAALGFPVTAVSLTVASNNTATLTIGLADQRPLVVHDDLMWTALDLRLEIGVNGDQATGTLTGTLLVGQSTAPVTTASNVTIDVSAGGDAVARWPLVLGGSVTLTPRTLTGLEPTGIELLLAELPALTGDAGSSSLTWITSGSGAKLAIEWPLIQQLTVWPQHLSVAGDTLGASIAPPPQPITGARADQPLAGIDPGWQAGLTISGMVTVLGVADPATVSLRHVGPHVVTRVAASTNDPNQLTVASLGQSLLGLTSEQLVAPVNEGLGGPGLAAKIAGSGFNTVAFEVGPGRGAIAIEGDGNFLGTPGAARLAVVPFEGGHGIGFDLRLNGTPRSVADIFRHDLGVVISPDLVPYLPTVELALREFRYHSEHAELAVGGTLAGTGWKLDLRIDAADDSGLMLEAGNLYGGDQTPPSLFDLLEGILPGASHDDLRSALLDTAPQPLYRLIIGTKVHHIEVDWQPAPSGGSSTGGAAFAIDLVAEIGTSPDPTIVSMQATHIAATQLGSGTIPAFWRLSFSSPLLRLDLVELAGKLGLPTGDLGLAAGDIVVELQRLEVSSNGIELSVEVDVAGASDPSLLTARIDKSGSTWTWNLSLVVGPFEFDLTVERSGGVARFRAHLADSAHDLSLSSLAEVLDVGPIPEAIDVAVDEITLVFEPDDDGIGLTATLDLAGSQLGTRLATLDLAGPPAERAFAVAAVFPDLRLGLDTVPIIGHLLSDPDSLTIALHNLELAYGSRALDATQADELNQLLDVRIGPSTGGLPAGLALSGTVYVGSAMVELNPTPGPVTSAPPTTTTTTNGATPTRGHDGSLAPPAGPISWSAVDTSLGPVHIALVGIGRDGADILVGVTGSISLSVIELTLIGMRVAVPLAVLSDPDRLTDLRFGLDGLGIDVRSPSVEIGGALVRSGHRLDGAAVLKTSGLSIKVLASLTETPTGEPSLFMYGVLDRAMGGPTFFYVTGLAAGVGYNRGLELPPVEGVPDFLLVKAAIDGAAADTVGDLIALLEDPTTDRDFPPEAGSMFIAGGVKFTSFKVVHSFLLIAVSSGHGTQISLLGSSTVQLPPVLDDVTPPPPPTEPPLARIELAIKAVYDVDRGLLNLRGALVHSYILSQKCTLTGGFAVVAHFIDDPDSSAKAGEFVATIGGYHPRFAPEPWYPKVPRLTLNWRISDNLEVTGTAYFALTPSTAMAGGSLDAHWAAGGLSARFTLAADFMVQWEPYRYWASFSMGISGSLHWGWFYFSISVHASVELYGPPFGGTATVDLDLVTKTIAFGAGRPPELALPVTQFAPKFLPEPVHACGAVVASGALSHDTDTDRWQVTAQHLELSVMTTVPATSLHAGVAAVTDLAIVTNGVATVGRVSTVVDGVQKAEIIDGVTLVPCGRAATSSMAFAVIHHAIGGDEDVTGHFDLTIVPKAQARALWDRADPTVSVGTTVQGIAGVTLKPRPKDQPPHTGQLPVDLLTGELINDEPEVAGLNTTVVIRRIDPPPPPPPVDVNRDGTEFDDVLEAFGFDPSQLSLPPRPRQALVLDSLASR